MSTTPHIEQTSVPQQFNTCVFRRSSLLIEACSTPLARLAGRDEGDELVGAFVIDLFSPRSLAAFETFLRAGDFSETVQCRMANTRSTEFTMVVAISQDDADRDLLTLFCVPVPDYAATISKLEGDLQALRDQNKQLVEFSSLLAHDLRGSLHAVLGNLDLLQHHMQAELSPTARDRLNRMQHAAAAMHRVLDDVTKLLRAREGSFPLELADMNAVVDQMIAEAASIKPDGVTIVRTDDLPPVMCREHLIRELVRNLLENSVKYGGSPPVQVEIGALQGDVPTFFVKDNGVGIHADDLESVLAPLIRADRDGLNTQGTGMGLALVRAIVDRHGGRLRLESERGVGTTVWFSLSEHGDGLDAT